MSEVTVRAPRQSVVNGWPTLAATIEIEGNARDVYIRASRGPLSQRTDAFLAAALLPAMRLNAPLRVAGSVSSLLLEHAARVQDVMCSWYPNDMHRVEVHAERVEARHAPPNAHVASFFSGGVDSFYNALKHVREIDDLVFIHGFDVPLWDTALRGLVSSRLHEAAGELGKPLLEVETNLRTVLDPYTHWNLQSHGAALGCVALALAPQLRRVYIGATHSYFSVRCHGSHPLLDPLWGHETMEVVHDGCEYERWPKAERIIANETVLRYLRVCWTNPRTTYNCGRCSNCVMMMVFLRATGMAEKCLTFPPLDLAQIASVEIATSSARNYFDDLLLIAEENGLDPALCDALRQRVKRAEDEGIGAYQASPELRRAQAEAAALKLDIKRVGAELKRIKESRSWRLTAPLRSASSLARRIVVTTPKKR